MGDALLDFDARPLWKAPSDLGPLSDTIPVANGAAITARDPKTFAGVVTHSRLRSIALVTLRADGHRGVRSAKLVAADPVTAVSLVFTRAGSIVMSQDGRTLDAKPGSLFITRSRATYRYLAPGPVAIVSVSVPYAVLPIGLVRELRAVTATALGATVLARSTLAYVEALVSSPSSPTENEAGQLEQQLLLLVSGLIEENVEASRSAHPGDSGHLAAAVMVIAANSSTVGYGPGDVARATGVDLRRLHRIFDAENVTVAELIRNTRLSTIADALVDPLNRSLMSDLATQAGFLGADQAARAFRRRYGSNMRAYRASHRP